MKRYDFVDGFITEDKNGKLVKHEDYIKDKKADEVLIKAYSIRIDDMKKTPSSRAIELSKVDEQIIIIENAAKQIIPQLEKAQAEISLLKDNNERMKTALYYLIFKAMETEDYINHVTSIREAVASAEQAIGGVPHDKRF